LAGALPDLRSDHKKRSHAENAPVGGETVYGLTKVDQERLVLLWGKQIGIPTVALRYSCTYGPRQSIFNPYTGVIAIFCTRC
jgi:Nucleoside-diphosphate-sugar epimerases